MITKALIRPIVDYTSIAWRGFFSEGEKAESVRELAYECRELKKGIVGGCDDDLNFFCNQLVMDIYGEEVENTYTYEEVEKLFNDYIHLIINGNMDYSKVQF